ncbi:hypothetical protein BHM03_00061786 [Ensete ventricosum]|nr:hypothetical protein BHM03_00061786 [Ensete ventricosum]
MPMPTPMPMPMPEAADPIVAAAVGFPAKKMEGFVEAPLSERGLEIAKSREELLRLLHDLPESEFELSLTDLVEKGTGFAGDPVANKGASLHEGQLNRATVLSKERRRRKKKQRSSSSRSSFGSSSSDGVLLNFYVPASLSRSLTTPRSSRRPAAAATTVWRQHEVSRR